MEKGTAARKMQHAYSIYGKPILDIVLDSVQVAELDLLEKEAIEIFDSVNNGFNTYTDAFQAPNTFKGVDASNAKFDRSQILSVFNLLVYSDKPYKEISELTGVTVGTISSISGGKNHSWLSEEYPNEYTLLLNKIGNRDNSKIVSDKLSAKSRGISYPKIKSPTGEVFTIDNAYAFAKIHGLAGNHLQEVLNGHRKSHKGWKCYE
jgi:uncharacterized protein YerC